MSKAIILQHTPHEPPGRIIPALRDFGIPIETRQVYRGDEVPTDLDEIRLLVVLGGPMSVSDAGSEKYPYLSKEIELLKRMIAQDRAVLGICLGAQLLAHAGGAKVYPNPTAELGWLPISLPFPGGTDPILFGVSDGSPMFHWHFETFDLPRLPAPANAPPPPRPQPPSGNALLSSTKTCKNQAFRFKNHLFGMQYHVEFTPEIIEEVLESASEKEREILGPGGLDKIRAETKQFYGRYERLGNRVLQNLVQFLKVYSGTGV